MQIGLIQVGSKQVGVRPTNARPESLAKFGAALCATARSAVRALFVPATIVAGFALAGCNTTDLASSKANKPIPEKLLAEMEQKNMDKQSPLLVRLFKQEAELEVWKQDRSGRFELLKTYPICRWSGELGPKVKEGDRQAPEGFYTITPAQMNPQSAYYLSFNMGYPNAYDRAWGRTGSQLMIHGDCSSRGCYAMTDEQIGEIYALGREAFFGGQRAFQVQAYPFRMTAANFAKHRNNPHLPFWKMLKQGSDIFEVTRQEPKVDVCERRYVFNAEAPANSSRAPTFNPTGKCPVYQLDQDMVAALQDKQHKDEQQFAQLVARGTGTAPARTGVDGGMHPVFASKLPNADSVVVNRDAQYSVASYLPAPGTIPAHVNPPVSPASLPAQPTATPVEAQASLAPPRAPAAEPARQPAAAAFAPPARPALRGTNAPAAPQATVAAKPAEKPVAKPASQAPADGKAETPAPAQQGNGTIAGAQPIMPAGGFENRWSAFR